MCLKTLEDACEIRKYVRKKNLNFVFQTSDIYSGEWARVWKGAIQSLPGQISSHTSSQTHYSTHTWDLLLSCRTASLRPCMTVDEWLRLLSRPTRFPKKCSRWPGEPPGLWGRALVSLEDQQGSDDEPEEEVDPHRRLKGGAEARERQGHLRPCHSNRWNPFTSALSRLL